MHATCELGALITWGGIPEVETVPEGGKFLLVTEAQEKACEGQNNILISIVLALHNERQLVLKPALSKSTGVVCDRQVNTLQRRQAL